MNSCWPLCDLCGKSGLFTLYLSRMILSPSALPRPARIFALCVKNSGLQAPVLSLFYLRAITCYSPATYILSVLIRSDVRLPTPPATILPKIEIMNAMENQNTPGLQDTAHNNGSSVPSDTQVPPPTDNLKSRHCRGWIAHLPKETRQRINEMLDDGLTYNAIVERLGEQGKELTERCVRSWKQGGYQDYLRQQEMLEQCRARQFSASSLLSHRGSLNAFQATQQVATAQICETVLDVGTDILRKALAENPLNYFRMLNSFARLTNGGLKCERHLVDEIERKAKARQTKKPVRKGVSPESLKEMEEKLNLM